MTWYLDLAIDGVRLVGKVDQLPTEGPKPAPGQIPRPAKWQARAMLAAWCDTPLGTEFSTRTDAMRAVATWWEGKKAGQ